MLETCVSTVTVRQQSEAGTLRKLLEPDAEKRLAHFDSAPTCMRGVLEEPFFKGETLEAATLETIVQNQEEMQRGQDTQMVLLIAIKDLSLENKLIR